MLDHALSVRVFRTMVAASAFAVIASAIFGSWRVTTGLAIGGTLALVNHHWLQSSTAAAFSVLLHGHTPRITVAKYVLRYLVIGVSVFAAYKLRIASLPAMVAGLCSFVIALFVEAIREFYFAIIKREEIT